MWQGMAHVAELVGRSGLVDMDGLNVRVKVLNFKSAYGTLRLLITPISGAGEKWIAMDRFTSDDEGPHPLASLAQRPDPQ